LGATLLVGKILILLHVLQANQDKILKGIENGRNICFCDNSATVHEFKFVPFVNVQVF